MSGLRAGTVGGVVVVVLMIAGCSAPKEEQAAAPAAVPAPAPSAPVVKLATSLNAAMVRIVDHSAHDLWEIERTGNQPKTEDAWGLVEHHATLVVGAGAVIQLEGTGVHDREWVADEKWQAAAKAMTDAGVAALKAAEARNFDGVVAANGLLAESCESCHKEFKPSLPSEGILHKHVKH